jgi:predicted porin
MSNQMKKSLLALAVLGSFAAAAQAQSSVTIYGILDTGIAYQSKAATAGQTSNHSLFSMQSGIMSGSRFGFKGSEDLGGGLKANFQLEAGINVDDGSFSGQDTSGSTVMFRRISTVGLSGGFGSVNLGRQTDFAYSGLGGGGMTAFSSAGYFGGFTGTNGTTQARLQGDRTNNSIRYDMNAIGGLTGGLMYGMGEQAGGGSAGAAYAAGLKYENGPLSVGGSYFKSKLGATPADRALYSGSTLAQALTNYNAGDQGTTTSTLGASYNFGGAGKLYGNWSRVKMQAYGTSTIFNSASIASTSANDKLDLYEIGYNYDLTASLKLMTAYSRTNVHFTSGLPQGKLDQLNIGTDYFLSKRTDLYTLASYARTSNVTNPLKFSTSSPNAGPIGAGGAFGVAVGIRHAF